MRLWRPCSRRSPARAPPRARNVSSTRYSARGLTASLIWLFVAGNGIAIVWLWYHGGDVTRVHSTGELLPSIARITGLLGAYLALLQVILLSRLPALERLAGFDRLTVWHRCKRSRGGYEALTVLADGRVLSTPGFPRGD